jgi:hypothetical protein
MKLLIALFVCAVSLCHADEIVFRGTPEVRVFSSTDQDRREKLDSNTADKNECVVVQRGRKYFWASRDNAPLLRVDAPQFTYFIHSGGAGYVKVFTGSRAAANAPADYVENINQGFEVITYWGKAESQAK